MSRKQIRPDGRKWTLASILENPLDVEAERFIIMENRYSGNPTVALVSLPPKSREKLRDLIGDIISQGYELLGVCPPGTTMETLEQIAASVQAEMKLIPVPLGAQASQGQGTG